MSVRAEMIKRVNAAEVGFTGRWQTRDLKRVDIELFMALIDQNSKFHAALVGGDSEQIEIHGSAMCRGWAKAVEAMQAHDAESAAAGFVMIGEFGEIVVAIGEMASVPKHLVEKYGDQLAYLRPREVAAMYMHYRQAQAVKAIWPDAEIIEVREKDGDAIDQKIIDRNWGKHWGPPG